MRTCYTGFESIFEYSGGPGMAWGQELYVQVTLSPEFNKRDGKSLGGGGGSGGWWKTVKCKLFFKF